MAAGWRGQYTRYKSFFLNITNVYKQRPDLKAYLEVLLSLTTIAVFGVFALRPTVLTIVELLQEIETKEQTVERMDTKIRNIGSAQTLFIQNEFAIGVLNAAVPDNPAPDTFVRQIEGLTGLSNVNILGMSIGEILLSGKDERRKTKSKELTPLPGTAEGVDFSLSITGDFQSLRTFLTTIEGMRRPTKIDSANINSSETDDGTILVLVIGGRVPFLRDDTK